MPAFGWFAALFFKLFNMTVFYSDDYPRWQLGFLAFFKVAAVLVDWFTDPYMAGLTDNLKSKYGRRKPFFMLASVWVPLTLTLSFTPPGFYAQNYTYEYNKVEMWVVNAWWFGICHISWKLCDKLLLIPLMSFGSEMTPNYKERTILWV